MTIEEDGSATVRVRNAAVTDQGVFLGPGTTPAKASFEITWTPLGAARHLKPGPNVLLTDPTNFIATFRYASVTGTFRVESGGVTYTGSWAGSGGNGIDFAEIGVERNGVFMHAKHHERAEAHHGSVIRQ